jgi:hypothetical protein
MNTQWVPVKTWGEQLAIIGSCSRDVYVKWESANAIGTKCRMMGGMDEIQDRRIYDLKEDGDEFGGMNIDGDRVGTILAVRISGDGNRIAVVPYL